MLALCARGVATKQRRGPPYVVKCLCSAWSSFLLQHPKVPESAAMCAFGGFYVILFSCSVCLHSTALKALHAPIQLVLCTAKVPLNQGQLFWEDRAIYRNEMFWTHALPGYLSRLYSVSLIYPPFFRNSQICCLPTVSADENRKWPKKIWSGYGQP